VCRSDTHTGGSAFGLSQDETIASLGNYGYGWADSDAAGAAAQRGLSEAVVRDISAKKNEPEWMLETV
jgi:Fe-S cluster assembly protein SufB